MSEIFDRPTAAELLEAVREFLVDEVVPGTSGRVAFHARVAANVVAMVERELASGPALLSVRQDRLSALGVATEAELANAIRDGRLDGRRDEVVAVVRASVDDRLRVANPVYLED